MCKVSVVIPTHNREKTISRAINSALSQTEKDSEIIVIDDGSTDNTKNIVENIVKKDSRVKYFWQKGSGGPAKPRNIGIDKSNGEYVAFLDSDDEWMPEKIEKQIKLLENNLNDVGFAGCNAFIINEGENKRIIGKLFRIKKVPKFSDDIFLQKLLQGNFLISSSSIIVRKSVLDVVGDFDENIRSGQDWDLWIRIAKLYNFRLVDEPLFKYYIHEGSIMENNKPNDEIKTRWYIFQKYKYDYEKHKETFGMFYRNIGLRYCAMDDFKNGRKYLMEAIKNCPMRLTSLIFLLLSYINKGIFKHLYSKRKFFTRKKKNG